MTALKILKWILITLLSLVALWIVAACVIIFFVAPHIDIKKVAEETINENIEAKSSISSVDFTFFSSFPYFAISIDDFAIFGKESCDTIVYVENTSCTIDVSELLQNRIAVNDVTLTKPYVNFVVDSTGSNNFSPIFKKEVQTTDSTTTQDRLDSFNFDNIAIEEGKLCYSNSTTGRKKDIDDLNFQFQGGLNMLDSVLEVREGKFFIDKNHFDFHGHIGFDSVDFNIAHDLGNLSAIKDAITELADPTFLPDTKFKGESDGYCHIVGALNDSLQGISISGWLGAKEIYCKSSKQKGVINDGNFELAYRLVTGTEDSTEIKLDKLNIQGEYISLQLDGTMSYKKNSPFIDAHLITTTNLTKFIEYTNLIPKSHMLHGNLKADITIHSSLYDLQNKYKLPQTLEDLFDLDVDIVLPNARGTINLDNFKILNDTITLDADKLNIKVDGKLSHLATDCHDFSLVRNGEAEKSLVKVKNADIVIDGKKLTASAKVDGSDVTFMNNSGDSTFVTAGLIDLKLACRGKDIANVIVDNLSYRMGKTSVYGKKFDGKLLKLSDKSKKFWDACSVEITSTKIADDNLKLFCQKMGASFDYDGDISGIKAKADSINIMAGEDEFYVKETSITSETANIFKLSAKYAGSGKEILGLDIDIHGMDATYNTVTNIASLKTKNVRAGNTDISAAGTLDLSTESPAICFDIKGKYLDLNEIMIASNKAALAAGDPNAIPLDSIPEGQIPVTVGAENQNIELSLDVNKMTLTSLLLSNATGKIYMKGRTTLIDDLNATDSGYKLNMSTMVSYVHSRLSINDIILNFKELDLSKLSTIIPMFDDATPILTTLKGNVNLEVVLRTPIRSILGIDMKESRAAIALQANDLEVTDNKTIEEIAKELLFKDREHIKIDSIAIAAELEHGQVKILPLMAKVDRYKLAFAGNNDMITKHLDYHISVLKSPIPFKFGINITGNETDQKVKLTKTELKKLDPSVKPWTDPGFIELNSTLKKPIEIFRRSIGVSN